MERLTYRDEQGKAHMICRQMCGDYGNRCDKQIDVDMCQGYVAYNRLADYEDAEEQGLLYIKVFTIEYECKYDKPVVCIVNCEKCDLGFLSVKERYVLFSDFDKTKHYKTQEEAEQALKDMRTN